MGIHWNLTPEEAQQIINIVAQRPYVEVANLIGKLAQQAAESQNPTGPKGVESATNSDSAA